MDTSKVGVVFAVLVCNAFGRYNVGHGTFDLLEERVVGGTPAAEGFIPYQASLRDKTNRHYCGGSILNDRWILTAAHCVKALNPSFIVVGTTKRTEGGDKYYVVEIISHPDYDSDNITNDVALIRTKESIAFSDNVKPIKLPDKDTLPGEDLMLSGWGKTSHPGSLPEDLQYIKLSSLNFNQCFALLSPFNQVTEKQICTFTRVGEGACHGDSGGPLATMDKETVVGVVSWGFPCARGLPDVFTRVFSYKSWIETSLSVSKRI